MRGVDALDVEGRIGLGVAHALRLGQHRGEGQPLVAHLRQDEVGGAVDDAGDPLDAVGRQAFAQRLDDGDAAADRGLEGDHHALLLRGGEDVVAVLGEQRLVGGDHVLAVGDRLQHQVLRDAGAADQLDHDVDVRGAHHFPGVGGQTCALPSTRLPRLLHVLVGDARDADGAAGAAPDLVGVAREHVPGAAADRADAEQPDVNRVHRELHAAPRSRPSF